MTLYNLVSLAGLLGLMAVAWAFSKNRRNVNVRLIGWGLVLQAGVGALVFLAPGSRNVLLWCNNAFTDIITAAQAGQVFLFGPLADPTPLREGDPSGFILAFQSLPLVIFFASVMSLLYYWRIMPRIIQAFAWVFTRLMRISGAESLCTASNIFVGVESATTVRPYLAGMTRSELCTILTAGMATVASTMLAVYVMFLGDMFPTIAGHLISASFLSAPAAIIMSKLLWPEDEEPATLGSHVKIDLPRDASAIDAIISGAMAGVRLVVGVAALLIALLGLLAVVDLFLGGATWHAMGEVWTLDRLLGWVMYPFALLIGVPPQDAMAAGKLLGERLTATELKAYGDMAVMMRQGVFQDPRTPVICAYALCGFAHVASLAIFVGGIAALVPERRKDLAAVGPRALLAATLACLMTGAIAGAFYSGGQTLLGNP